MEIHVRLQLWVTTSLALHLIDDVIILLPAGVDCRLYVKFPVFLKMLLLFFKIQIAIAKIEFSVKIYLFEYKQSFYEFSGFWVIPMDLKKVLSIFCIKFQRGKI